MSANLSESKVIRGGLTQEERENMGLLGFSHQKVTQKLDSL
jgi:hypothetical protein